MILWIQQPVYSTTELLYEPEHPSHTVNTNKVSHFQTEHGVDTNDKTWNTAKEMM